MTEEKIQLIIGGLLHDIGKIIYRNGDGRKHSLSGYEYLKNDIKIDSDIVLDSVRYHHVSELRTAHIPDNSYAYITYIADNIASSADRRKNESEDKGFVMTAPLEPVFNILNGNDKKMYYHKGMLGDGKGVNYPTKEKEMFDKYFYQTVKHNLEHNLNGIVWDEEYINSLLQILEANLSYVPSSTATDELADISLYDHVKLTAAINSCILEYLNEKEITNYKEKLYKNALSFYEENAFLLFSMDVSGIQNFIYTVHSEGALKNLRARSFYLEIMMEHLIDTLLTRLELSRANVIYSGGGHCYLLLPNTSAVRNIVAEYEQELNEWLLDKFDISLYVAVGLAECSANALKNYPQGSYSQIFENVRDEIAKKKSKRYSVAQIIQLNQKRFDNYERECRVCKRIGLLDEQNQCKMCSYIAALSKNVLYSDFFSVIKAEEDAILPFQATLIADNEETVKKRMLDDRFIRVYCKNRMFTGKHVANKLWVGNYTTGETFEELADAADGIKRIGILRADVDNLGKTFVSGFESEKNQDRYVTLSRTATLSRQLSLFFKYHINHILKKPQYSTLGKECTERKATIVYSGGDDLFIVGAWNDVLELSVDIRNAFCQYTENTLSLSAGIGLYQPGYPIHASAVEVANLEDASKNLPHKNAITFLDDGEKHDIKVDGRTISVKDATYCWEEFCDEVIADKYKAIWTFFNESEDKGKNFLYHLLELIRGQGDKINLARYIYLLARMEPGEKASPEEKQRYSDFSKQMYQWIKCEKDCRHLKTAITLYSYTIRTREE